MRLLPVFLLLLAIAACGVLPRPFQPEEKVAPEQVVPRLGARAGVVVRPIQGLPAPISVALVDNVVATLQERSVPASARFANRGSLELRGRVDPAEEDTLTWVLADPDGLTLLRYAEPRPRPSWIDTTVLDVASIADRVAERVTAILEPPPADAGPDLELPPVVVWTVDGAPGDGGRALARAMRRSLAGSGIDVVDALTDEAFLVLGSVYVVPDEAAARTEIVEIAWTVLRPDGARIGTVSQQNRVQEGTLNRRWGAVADAVAAAGAPGITAMLRRTIDAETRPQSE
jgi:hypothetical protein